LRRSTKIQPAEFERLDALIASTHEEINGRIQKIFTTDESNQEELLEEERGRCEKFNGEHWNTRIMSKHIQTFKEHTMRNSTLVPIQTFINERCVKEEGAFTSASDLYSAYTEWHSGLSINEGQPFVVRHFGRYLTPLIGKSVLAKHVRGRAGIRLKRPDEESE